jgi:hypothetical protein
MIQSVPVRFESVRHRVDIRLKDLQEFPAPGREHPINEL